MEVAVYMLKVAVYMLHLQQPSLVLQTIIFACNYVYAVTLEISANTFLPDWPGVDLTAIRWILANWDLGLSEIFESHCYYLHDSNYTLPSTLFLVPLVSWLTWLLGEHTTGMHAVATHQTTLYQLVAVKLEQCSSSCGFRITSNVPLEAYGLCVW